MITLNIEDNAIKVLLTHGNRVKKAINQPLSPGLVKDGVILDPKLVGKAVRELFIEHNIRDRSVVVSVSGVHSIYRLAHLPKLTGDLLAEAAKREMARLFPVPLEEIYTSWQTVGLNNEIQLALIGIPRETIDFLVATLKEAELDSKLIEPKPLAISRVTDETDAIIINVQPVCFDIVIMIGGIPQLVRSLPFSQPEISEQDKIRELREELDKTIIYYNSSNPANPITEDASVFISGEYRDLISESISYNKKKLPDLLVYPPDFNIDEYAVNIGLALGQRKSSACSSKVSVNVLPEIYQPKPVSMVHVVSWIFVLIATVILVFNIISVQQIAWQNAQFQKQVKNLRAVVNSMQASKPEIDKLKANLEKIKAEQVNTKDRIDSCRAQRKKVNMELGTITGLVTGKIVLKSISYDNSWSVRGTAPNSDLILSYVFNLQNSSRFSSVQLSSMNQVEYNKWEFIISLSSL